ncbi:MAG: ABC transporter permease [Planctomycetota bacterium]|jgi:ribose transport system permease protein
MKRILGNKVLGIGLLVLVVALVGAFATVDSQGHSRFLSAQNLDNLLPRIGRFCILSLAAAFVIVTGGIDLSIGAVCCVAGCVLPALVGAGVPPALALLLVLLLCALLGAWHGFLVVGLRLQPFVVTLCGLLVYRGAMRAFSDDQSMSVGTAAEGLRWLSIGALDLGVCRVPVVGLVLLLLAAGTAVLWSRTVWGRHLFALGRNEEAARFSGVPTARLTLLAYVACSLLAGFGGCLLMLDVNSVQAATFGNFYELYAIAGAVLGGVALRGGEGSVLGLVLGVALMQVLSNVINLTLADNRLEFVVVGAVILLGAAADEGVRRLLQRRVRS